MIALVSLISWAFLLICIISFMYIFTTQNYNPSILVLSFLAVLIVISIISIGLGFITLCVHHRVFYIINGVLFLFIFVFYMVFMLLFFVARPTIYTAVGKFWGNKDFKFDYWIENQLKCCGYPKRNNTACDKRLYTCDVVFEYKFKKRMWYVLILFIFPILQLIASIYGFVGFRKLNSSRVEAESEECLPEESVPAENIVPDSKLIPQEENDQEDTQIEEEEEDSDDSDEEDEEEEEKPRRFSTPKKRSK